MAVIRVVWTGQVAKYPEHPKPWVTKPYGHDLGVIPRDVVDE
jgi:hypothetical protein